MTERLWVTVYRSWIDGPAFAFALDMPYDMKTQEDFYFSRVRAAVRDYGFTDHFSYDVGPLPKRVS